MALEPTRLWSWWWNTNNKADETSTNILMLFVPLLLAIIISLIFHSNKRNKVDAPMPPGPRGLPIVGYLPFLDYNLHHSFKELANLYGPIFKLRLGTKQCIVVTSPTLVKEIVRDQDVVFANRVPTVAATTLLFGTFDIAFSNHGPEWRKMRKIFATEMLSNAGLDASYCLRKQHIEKMLCQTCNKAGDVVDVGKVALISLVGAVMNMIWGDTLEGDKCLAITAEFRAVVNELLELLGAPNVSDLFPFLARFDLQGIDRRVKIISRQIEEVFDKAMNHLNMKDDIKRIDFLGNLLQLTKGDDDSSRSLTLPQLKTMLLDAAIGATDTTVSLVEWAMGEILKNPEILRKVQEELTEIVGLNNLAEEAHSPKLKYLNAVVKETLRLHPPFPLLVPRCPSELCYVGGYRIPKGTCVFLNVYTMHQDPQLWEDPLLFRPERFLAKCGDADKMDQFQYLPFGSGRRICPGMPLAERMSMHVLASLLHSFWWKLPNDSVEVDLSEKFGIVMKKSKPLLAVPSPRLSNMELYS